MDLPARPAFPAALPLAGLALLVGFVLGTAASRDRPAPATPEEPFPEPGRSAVIVISVDPNLPEPWAVRSASRLPPGGAEVPADGWRYRRTEVTFASDRAARRAAVAAVGAVRGAADAAGADVTPGGPR